MFVEYNPNPVGNNVGDCVIRAITKAMDKSWEDTYIDIVVQGFLHSDMPSSNHVWDAYLRDNGFNRYIMPNFCPDCYTVAVENTSTTDGTTPAPAINVQNANLVVTRIA